MNNFHGGGKKRAYFEGWYFKHQGAEDSLALIPAFHVDEGGRPSASLQVITGGGVHWVDFPPEAFSADPAEFRVRIGNSVFSQDGCSLSLDADGLMLEGRLQYGPFTPVLGDIMGPFRFVPGLQCRHSVFSLTHRVDGQIVCNGRSLTFDGAVGYLEGDRGASFPRRYLWTQCNHGGDCIMISVAHIPVLGGSFTGCIASVLASGKEYRLATYRGVALAEVTKTQVLLRQGALTLEARLLEDRGQPLRAPQRGGMTRTIHESLSCRVGYRFTRGGHVLLEFESNRASFESVFDP